MVLPKPPKLFHRQPEQQPTPVESAPIPEEQRVWSPSQPASAEPVVEATAPTPAVTPETTTEQSPTAETLTATAQVGPESQPEPQLESQPEPTPVMAGTSAPSETKANDFSRYARPQASVVTEAAPEQEDDSASGEEPETDTAPALSTEEVVKNTENAIERQLGPDQKFAQAPSLSTIPFSDIWYTAEKIAYIRDPSTSFALIPIVTNDLEDFYKALEQGYTGHSSYAIRFAGEAYRVERITTLSGIQYNCRKMPGAVPDIFSLGLPRHIVDHLLTLSHESGLILFGGPTGMGKTTSASALMKRFLEVDGGFMYTIEDPPEMPLDGLYKAEKGGLGLCKQCPVVGERWGEGIKSALRSRPRYILVGEIRTPETASQVLRAATSGHLVLSTIHASTVEDALESLIKYASGAGLTESLAADLLARGILAVVHQKLEGVEELHPVLSSVFANPHLVGGDQLRSLIRSNSINLQTLIEAQSSRLMQGRPLFSDV